MDAASQWRTVVASLDGEPALQQHGTAVPTVGLFSSTNQATGKEIATLRQLWYCAAHTRVCIRDPDNPNGPHTAATHPHLNTWGTMILAKQATREQPPQELLEVLKLTGTKPRGRPRQESALEATLARVLDRPEAPAAPAPVTVHHRSSPPPSLLDDHLKLAIEAFGRESTAMSGAELRAAYAAFQANDISPESFESLNAEELAQVASLSKGKAAALRTFIVRWNEMMAGKRKRQRIR
ncbi:hypothetical protein AURDEDRAFT_175999 [Auricularia subglabra TFB-10046 SS5]|nr:hypothetical protein AURDEDRAFT_175999 [Auricularia subglabra TFB-10046 SS5]